MGHTRKDAGATALTALVVLVFVATHQSWDVWLVGGSHRWAAGAITLLGVTTCGLGSPEKGARSRWLALLGVAAAVLAVLSLATGSLTPLSLLVADIVALWAVSTLGHVRHAPRKPVAA